MQFTNFPSSTSDFFSSDIGKQLTNVGTTWLTNQLGLTSKGNSNPAVVRPTAPVVQVQNEAASKNTLYWIIGGVAVVGVALIFVLRK